MSTFEDDRYQWRETYFVLFDPAKKPLLHEIRQGLATMFRSLRIREALADGQGGIESLSIASYDDFAAIDLVYQCGDYVIQETDSLVEEMLRTASTKTRTKVERARKCRARLDVLHFEQMEPVKHPKHPESPGAPVFLFTTVDKEKPPPARNAAKNPFSGRPKFQFDQNRYIPPPELVPLVSNDLNEHSVFGDEHSDQEDQMDPNTLILVLELLCRLTDGVAIDPASGAILI